LKLFGQWVHLQFYTHESKWISEFL
jgi:hypothetical protein